MRQSGGYYSSMTGQAGTSSLTLDVEVHTPLAEVPDAPACIAKAVNATLSQALTGAVCPMELYVELTDNDHSQQLNAEYRGKDYATNVLSFPATEPDDLSDAMRFSLAGGPPVLLGDLVIASAVVEVEAKEQNKPVEHHFMHMIVHGVLHLLGYDHIEDIQADEMENLEKQILGSLNIPDPYAEQDQ